MCEATNNVLAAQSEIGVRLRDGSHPAIKVLASKADWHVNRFIGYFPANPDEKPTQLPMGAFYTLVQRKVLPETLLSLLLPDDYPVIRVPTSIDVEEVTQIAMRVVELKNAAHHPDSPAGVQISDCEREGIAAEVVKLAGVA